MKYISQKYLLDFKLDDEGHYWETGDEQLLRKTFARYNDLLYMVCDGIQNFPTMPGETIEAYFERLMAYLNKKRDSV